MEAKFLASALSFLSIFLAIYAQSFANDIVEIIDNIGNNNSGGRGGGVGGGGPDGADESTEFEGTPAIYYGDSNVNLGEPFSITCIIPITEGIFWLKNGEPITRHNLRHGRDEHAYILAESAIEEPELVPNYDNVEHQMKFYTIKSPLVLSCNVKNMEPSGPLVWKKNHTSVMDVASLRGRFRLIEAEQKFIIDKAEPQDDGLYSCEINNLSKEIKVLARVVVRVPSNTAVVEGEKMSVTCSVVGTEPQLIWTYRNLTLRNSTGRYILSPNDNVENAILTLENVTLDDKGDYKCYGSNAANDYSVNSTVASDFTTVRVKGKFAALWPFLGICAEVLILCVIILIYEKRRNKSELEESDTDPQEQ